MNKFIFCRPAWMFLKWGLFAVSAVLIYIAFTRASLDIYDATRLHTFFVEQMEHALMSLLLVIGGGVLLDIEVKKRGK
ncbi:MAG: hypothetical protein IJY93_05830 [Clostridia bacterium]|nr:hypothetical protein [Clostridia bacterium]